MKYADFNGEKIDINKYKESIKNNLTCIYCKIPITHVRGCVKRIGDKDVVVRPYFRLKNKETSHHSSCKYITSNAIQNIFAGVADDDLMTKHNGKYLVRLHIITDNVEKRLNKGASKDTIGTTEKKPTKKYIRNGERPAYLSTLKKIVELKDAIEEDKKLRNLVTLQFYNEYNHKYDVIKWKDFYMSYDLKSYKYIYDMVKKGRVYHPICFEGEIKEVVKVRETYYIKFYSLKIKDGEYYSFSVATKNEDVFNYATTLQEKRVVIYGCSHYVSKKGNKNGTTYLNFSSYVNVKTQIFVLD